MPHIMADYIQTQQNMKWNDPQSYKKPPDFPPLEKKSQPLKNFKGQELEKYYMQKKLKPEIEKEIKRGFFEIRKKFNFQEQ